FSTANAISADGSVIVGWGNSANGNEAFRRTEADGMVGLGDLEGGGLAATPMGSVATVRLSSARVPASLADFLARRSAGRRKAGWLAWAISKVETSPA